MHRLQRRIIHHQAHTTQTKNIGDFVRINE